MFRRVYGPHPTIGRALPCTLFWLGLAWTAASGAAGGLHGRITDINGRPLANVMASLDRGLSAHGAAIVTVFSDAAGNYRFPTEAGAGTLFIKRLGYRPETINVANVAPQGVDFALTVSANVAASAPASAWLAQAPETAAKHLTQLMCTGCHQFPTPKVRNYATALTTVPGGEALSGTERRQWQHRVKLAGWHAAVKYMRAKTYDIFPEGSSIQLSKLPWEMIQNPAYALFNDDDETVIAEFLAEHMPTQFDYLPAYEPGAPSAVNGRTVIREYRLPDTSVVREVVVVRGSPYIWGADVHRNRLLRLDPASGEQRWFDVPYDKATGPHTIIGDIDGKVWVTMIESDILGRFDPDTEKWQLWKLNETGTEVFGGQAVVHDITYDHTGELARDGEGRIWLTLVGSNKMASLDPQSGEVHHYPAPPVAGRTGVNITLYGTLLSADGRCAWFSQLNGYVGCFNTETLESESLLAFEPGAGPRRMSIDRDGILWIPLFGSGQIVKYDTHARRELERYDLPDRSAAPYAVTWDARRDVLWVANSNADALYRFDPASEAFTVLPLPRAKSYLRQLALHPESNDLIVTYGHLPVGSGPSMALTIAPGD